MRRPAANERVGATASRLHPIQVARSTPGGPRQRDDGGGGAPVGEPARVGSGHCLCQTRGGAALPWGSGGSLGLRAVAGGGAPVTPLKTNRPIDPVEPKPAKLVIELLRLNWSNQLEISKRAGPIRRGACGPGRRGSLTGAGRRRIAARALPGQRARPDSGEVAAAAGSAQTADAFA